MFTGWGERCPIANAVYPVWLLYALVPLLTRPKDSFAQELLWGTYRCDIQQPPLGREGSLLVQHGLKRIF